MKRIVSGLFFEFLRQTRGWPLKHLYAGDVQILMFHRVLKNIGRDRVVNDGIEVTADYLEALILYYRRHGFIPVSVNELPALLAQKRNKRYVVYTFDDGYLDNYEVALPVFEKYNIPFAVYVTTDFVERRQFAWWYFLEDLLRQNDTLSYGPAKLDCSTPELKQAAFMQLRGIIQANADMIRILERQYRPDLEKYHRLFLSKEQLTAFAAHPLVTIGSHTLSHPSLANTVPESVYRELADSKKLLEEWTGKKVEHLAYPFGTTADVSEREMKYAEAAGYVTALTTVYGDVHIKRAPSLFALPRIWTDMSKSKRELLKIVSGYNEWK